MKIVDKRGKWMHNFSQFRMHDPMSDTYFESGETVKAEDTAWRRANKAIIKLTDEEGNLVDDPDLDPPTETKAEAAVKAIAEAETDPKGTVPVNTGKAK